jgi:hypothetical protein
LAAWTCHAQPAAQSLIDLKPEPLVPGAPSAATTPHTEMESEPAQVKPPSRFWFQGEYLLWWIKDSSMPPLVTTGPLSASLPGALGQPGTQVLFGGNVDNNTRSGGRFTGGYWCDDEHSLGFEAAYLFLGSHAVGVDLKSSGLPGSIVLGQPFFDVVRNAQDVGLVAFQGLAAGEIAVSSSSRLQGAECNVLTQFGDYSGLRCEALAGFRFLQLDESIDIFSQEIIAPNTQVIGGDKIATGDFFTTQNCFYGGQIGARARYDLGRFFVDVVGKVALGDMNEVLRIHGGTAVTTAAGATNTFTSGFLALSTNSGEFSKNVFAVVPEFTVAGGYAITDHFRILLGYTFLYVSNVARPGSQIDLGLNPTQIPLSLTAGTLAGPARPAGGVKETQFWAQGLNFGFEFQF